MKFVITEFEIVGNCGKNVEISVLSVIFKKRWRVKNIAYAALYRQTIPWDHQTVKDNFNKNSLTKPVFVRKFRGLGIEKTKMSVNSSIFAPKNAKILV